MAATSKSISPVPNMKYCYTSDLVIQKTTFRQNGETLFLGYLQHAGVEITMTAVEGNQRLTRVYFLVSTESGQPQQLFLDVDVLYKTYFNHSEVGEVQDSLPRAEV